MPEPTIVTLTGYPDILEQFYRSVQQHELEASKIVVTSGEASRKLQAKTFTDSTPEQARIINGMMGFPNDAQVIAGPDPFIFSRNANLGIKACKGDVLLVNDDVEFLRSGTLATLRKTAMALQNRCIVSPQISGVVGNPLQWYETRLSMPVESEQRLCFVCVYIPRLVFDTIGLLDESFTGYGGDDSDFCIRARKAGFHLIVTPHAVVRHGFQEYQWSSSYRRLMAPDEYRQAAATSAARYQEKWGVE